MTAPRLTHVFNLSAYSTPVAFPTEVNDVCNLYVAAVEGGTLTTADGKSSFDVLNAADWMTMAPSGKGIVVDARVTTKGQDGALDLRYLGKLNFSEELQEMMLGKRPGTEFGEGYYYVSPHITTRSEGFTWVNDTVFLGQGRIRMREDGKLEVSYRIYKVE